MFYEPKDGHGLPHNPLNACVVPRPIGLLSTVSRDGVFNVGNTTVSTIQILSSDRVHQHRMKMGRSL